MKSLEVLNKETVELIEKNNYLRRLVRKEIFHESIKNIKIKDELIDQAKKEFMEIRGIKSNDDYLTWLKSNKFTDKEIDEGLFINLQSKKFYKDNFGHMVHTRFLKKKNDLEQVIYSLIRVNDYNIAVELYQKIKENEANFGDLAKNFSTGPEKDSRGITGPTFISKSHPKLAEVIRSHKIDELIEPFRIDQLWLIVRIESITEVTLDKDMEEFLEKELFEEWVAQKTHEK